MAYASWSGTTYAQKLSGWKKGCKRHKKSAMVTAGWPLGRSQMQSTYSF